MKIVCLAILAALAASALFAADPKITPDERAKAIQLLKNSEKEFLESVEKLSDAQWNYKPAPERWSVGEVAEHILLAEGQLFGAVQRALAQPADPDWEKKTAGKTEFLERALLNRDHKAQAPESIQPHGKLPREEVVSRFKEARARTLKFIEETGEPLKEHTLDHPFPVFGTLNAYQWLIYIPLHNMRHDKQIAEVQADAGFPKQ